MDSKDIENIVKEIKSTADEMRGNIAEYRGVKSKVDELAGQLKELAGVKEAVALLQTKGGRPGAAGDVQPDAAKKAFLEYLCKGKERMSPESVKALHLGDDTKGGYLVPPDFIAKVIEHKIDYSPIRQLATVQPTSRGEVQIPRESGYFGAVWVGETEAHTDDDDSTYSLVLEDLKAFKMVSRVPLSNDLAEDSPIDVENLIASRVALKFGITEGTAFVTGTGAKQPEGIMTNADVSAVAGGDASLITVDGMLSMGDGIPSYYDANSTYIMKKATRTSIRKLKDSNGVYYWQAPLTAGMPQTFNGFPIALCPDMATIGANAYPVAFGDFRAAYMIVDSKQMTMLRDEISKADYDMTVLRFKQRVGGQVVQPEAIAKLKIATSV
ncbi:MAG: phage major capsid protein [Dehalococcoidia bacterium]|jgi:HK97 family phage major capsid protein|nr:phage major capsid protein [Dehalococcoidia bacterium]